MLNFSFYFWSGCILKIYFWDISIVSKKQIFVLFILKSLKICIFILCWTNENIIYLNLEYILWKSLCWTNDNIIYLNLEYIVRKYDFRLKNVMLKILFFWKFYFSSWLFFIWWCSFFNECRTSNILFGFSKWCFMCADNIFLFRLLDVCVFICVWV